MNLLDVTVSRDEFQYRLQINQRALRGAVEGQSFSIIAERIAQNGLSERIRLVASILYRDGGLIIIIRHNHKELARWPVTDMLAVDVGVEEIIDQLPPLLAGDPIIGCAIRAGLSAVLGQSVQCYRLSSQMEHIMERAMAVLHCLRQNLQPIGMKAGRKFFSCIAGF